MRNWLMTIFSIFLLLTGNRFPSPEVPCRVVTAISIQVTGESTQYQCFFTEPEELSIYLNYLRCLSLWDDAQTPPPEATEYAITLHYSDGATDLYTQKGYEHFRKGEDSWKELNPELGIFLPLMLAAVPGDT